MSNLEFGFQHGMWDLCRESGVKYEILKRRCVDICCLQVVRWKGQGAKTVENGFKFLWSGYGFMAYGYGSESSGGVDKVASCHDGRELFRIVKQRGEERCCWD